MWTAPEAAHRPSAVATGWLWLFRAAAVSHLIWAALFVVTDPRCRWDCQGYPVGGRHVSTSSPALRCQLQAADRQVAVGFMVSAFLARTCDPLGFAGVRAAVALLLWNGALLLNGGGAPKVLSLGVRAAGPQGGLAGEAGAAFGPVEAHQSQAWYKEEEFPPLELPQMLLVAHTCLAAAGAASFLVFHYANVSFCCVQKWMQGLAEQRRRRLDERHAERSRLQPHGGAGMARVVAVSAAEGVSAEEEDGGCPAFLGGPAPSAPPDSTEVVHSAPVSLLEAPVGAKEVPEFEGDSSRYP